MGPACACGCGENLPEGSTRAYKRGHKARAPGSHEARTEPVTGFFEGASVIGHTDLDAYTIYEAAQDTPDDPSPAGMQKEAYSVPVKITAAVRKDIEGKLAFMFSMTGNMLQLADPVCGGAILENSPQMAKALTPIICQSPGVVKWLRSSGSFVVYTNFLMACAPVLSAIYAHHLSARPPQEPASVPYTSDYYGVQ